MTGIGIPGKTQAAFIDFVFFRSSICHMSNEPIKGPASYFPSIEKKYGRPIADWQDIIRKYGPAKHMELVASLKADHGMGHGHANALVAYTLAQDKTA